MKNFILRFTSKGLARDCTNIKHLTQIKLFNSSKSFVVQKTYHKLFNCVYFEASFKTHRKQLEIA